jgi:hypothetical protein
MDGLIAQFSRSTTLHFYNPTQFELEFYNEGVHTHNRIPADTVVGEIEGDPAYIWDISHNDYIIVGEDFVLDCSKLTPRPILTMVREENSTNEYANCMIVSVVNERTGYTKFFLKTIADVWEGTELVYTVDEYMYH